MDHFPEAARLRVEGGIREAIDLIEHDKKSDAVQTMNALVNEFPESGLAHAYLAWVFSNVGDHRKAIQHGTLAIQFEPDQERISLLYFRVLWGAHEYQQAFDEMQRFSLCGYSEEYTRMMHEWKGQ